MTGGADGTCDQNNLGTPLNTLLLTTTQRLGETSPSLSAKTLQTILSSMTVFYLSFRQCSGVVKLPRKAGRGANAVTFCAFVLIKVGGWRSDLIATVFCESRQYEEVKGEDGVRSYALVHKKDSNVTRRRCDTLGHDI